MMPTQLVAAIATHIDASPLPIAYEIAVISRMSGTDTTTEYSQSIAASTQPPR